MPSRLPTLLLQAACVVFFFAFASSQSVAASADFTGALTIFADASEIQKRGVAVRLSFPVKSREISLVYPKWLPGSHAAQGSLGNIARLQITGNGVMLGWRRDPYDPYIILATVPGGVKRLEVTYDYVAPRRSGEEVFYGVASGKNIAVINPAAFALAPKGDPREMTASFAVRLPKGWTAATALVPLPKAAASSPETIPFAPTSLYTLIDSPLIAGAFRKSVEIPTPPGDVSHTLDLFAESEDGLKKESVVLPLFTRMVAESGNMFGSRHYSSFHFMLALTDEIAQNGLEHHASVAYVLPPGSLDRAEKQVKSSPTQKWVANLIPHEFIHSWNGKYRRPYGEAVNSNVAPQSADLVWVYEGLTEYLGEVLMVRSGFLTLDEWRLHLARETAELRVGQGRDWQSVADAALTMPHTYVRGYGTSLRPVDDVYMEGRSLWLEADTIIRRESAGKRTLDDFCRVFFGGFNKGAEVIPYSKADVVRALRVVQPYDWERFIESRFYARPDAVPLDSIGGSGWKLVYADAPKGLEPVAERDLRFSLGFLVSPSGSIGNVLPGSLAERAGVRSGATIWGVDGFRFTQGKLREAIQQTGKPGAKKPIELLLAEDDRYFTVRFETLSGERFPVLTRVETGPDILSQIFAAQVGQAAASTAPGASGVAKGSGVQ